MNSVKTPTSDSYVDALIVSLKKPSEAAHYLTAILEVKDPENDLLKLALSDVAKALGEVSMSPELSKSHIQELDELLKKQGSEAIFGLVHWLNMLGLKIEIAIASETN
ncbi:transcriptional regulator [Tumidithrix elongata RA019]|uniref:Transcriptional regulator n=1 Tax=Tumidithrix elongata BACA0141 TaxID=2716417 RepID=A0AAW9PS22_9CYAN|nr:transcriptional regulator [Tumidithrix elongata RA019]